MSDKDSYKSPLRKLVQFFEKSRDTWKAKSLANKKENRQLKKKLQTLEISKKRWKDERLLGSSEIIESVFGKQKHLERDYAKEGFTSLILGIGAFVGEMTVDTVKEAFIYTPVKTIVKGYKEELGETLQSKKIEAYSKVRNGIKSGLILCDEK